MKLFWDAFAFQLKFVILGPLDELPDIFCGCRFFFFSVVLRTKSDVFLKHYLRGETQETLAIMLMQLA